MTSEALLIDRRNEVRWYPMRVTYGREEAIRQCLLSDAVENFLPMRHEVYADERGHVRHRHIPAVRNLIFLHASQQRITEMKMFQRQYQPLRYMTDLLHHNILTVPDKQMTDFIRVASAPDDSVSVMAWNDDFFGKPGTKVRITDGDFKGVEGVIRRIKQNKRMIKLSGAKTSVFSTRASEPERDYTRRCSTSRRPLTPPLWL